MTRFISTFFFVLIYCVFYTQNAYSNNRHDHIYSIPSAQNFSDQIDAVLNLKNKSQEFRKFFTDSSELITYLQNTFSIDEKMATELVNERGLNLTLKELFTKLGGNPKIHFEKMLSASASNPDHKMAYLYAERIRLGLLLSLDKETVRKIFNNYFTSDEKRNHSVLDISVSGQFQDETQVEKLYALRDLANQYQSKLNFFISIPRRNLEKDILELSPQTEKLKNIGLIGGLDISGSIGESHQPASSDINKEAIKKNLRALFVYASDHKIPLRIHAFEEANTGIFYDILKEELLQYQGKNLAIRIGHIAKINKEWCEIFNKIKPSINVKIEANISSNLYLNKSITSADLYQNILLAKKYSIPVYFGSDGRGIIDNSSYLDQRMILKPHVENSRRINPLVIPINCSQAYSRLAQ